MIRSLFFLIILFELACGFARAGELPKINFDRIVFLSSWTKPGKVYFSNGEYREPAATGPATELIVRLTDPKAFGKLDGEEVGAVIVVTDPGGSGSFYDLALLVKKEQDWIHQDTAFLGDRIKIHSLTIVNDGIAIDLTNHGPGDAMCCPTHQVIQRFALKDDRLIKTSEEVQERPAPLLTGTEWRWLQTLYSNDRNKVPPNPGDYTLRFLPDGKVSIRADCNRGGGVYALRKNKISIEITHTTRAACPPESLEQDYIRDLNAASIYFIREGLLHIDLKVDTGTMHFIDW